jgi:hypothetical protein
MSLMASYSIEVDTAALRLVEDMRSLTTDVLEVVAGFAISEIENNIPPLPQQGSQTFVSAKQRRYVMAMIQKGVIKVPYVRGGRAAGSENLTKSMYVMRESVDSVQVVSTARYAPYVIGDQQAPISPKPDGSTGMQAAERLIDNGTIDRIVNDAIAKAFS